MIIAGIDIGTHTTRVVVCQYGKNLSQPHNMKIIATATVPSNGMHQGYVINRNSAVASLRQAIREAEKQANATIENAYVAIGGMSLSSLSLVTTVPISNNRGEVSEKDIDLALHRCEDKLHDHSKNLKVLHAFTHQYKIDGTSIMGNPIGLEGRRLSLRATFITCFEHHYFDLVNVIDEAGINVLDVIAAPLAASEAIMSPKDKVAGAALIDIGADTTTISTYEHGDIISTEVFPIGSNAVTHDIALGFQISLSDAENIKQRRPRKSRDIKIPKAKLDTIIEARITDILELVEKHLIKIRRSRLLPAGITMIGGGSLLKHIHKLSREQLQLPLRIPDVARLHMQQKVKLPDISWCIAYGVCVYGVHFASNSFKTGRQGKLRQKISSFFKQLLP